MDEGEYVCPNCGESIVVPVDASAGRDQEYVEDCPVCCSPNLLRVTVERNGAVRIEAEPD